MKGNVNQNGKKRTKRLQTETKQPEIKKQYFEVRECIFNRIVHVFINYSHDEFAKVARRKGAKDYKDDPDYDNNFAAFSTQMGIAGRPDQWVICIKEFNWTIADQGKLVHEIVHTIIRIWTLNVIPFTPDNQEFLAYSIGNLYEDIAAKIHSLNSQKKRVRKTTGKSKR